MTIAHHRSRQEGQIIPLLALSLVVLLGALAVVLDGGRVYSQRRNTQNAADAAAMAGASVLVQSDPAGSASSVYAAACAAANANGGFGSGSVDGTCGPTGSAVIVHIPGSGTGSALSGVNPVFENAGYVQVRVQTSFKSFMSSLLGLGDFAASSLAVAVNIPGNALGATLLVLDPIDCGALTFNGTNVLNVTGGDIVVDSNAAWTSGPYCSNKNAAIKSGVGTGSINNPSGANRIVGTGDAVGYTPAWTPTVYQPDPLTRVSVPYFDNTTLTNNQNALLPGLSPAGPGIWNIPQPWTGMGTATAKPGVYWGGITVKSSDTLHLMGGTYIMAGGGFNVAGTVDATGGVTIIMTDDPYCNSKVSSPPLGCNSPAKTAGNLDGKHADGSSSSLGQTGNSSWGTQSSQLQAQTLSPDPYNLTNILIYVDRNAVSASSPPNCTNTTLNVGGSGYFNFATGSVIYAPCSAIVLSGTSVPPSHAGAVVGYTVTVNGTKDFNLGGPGQGLVPVGQSSLVQ